MNQFKHIFITDPLESLTPNHDSSLAMMREAYNLGHQVYQAEIKGLSWAIDHVELSSWKLEYSDNKFSKKEENVFNLSATSASTIWMRKDPPVDENYVRACQLLRLSKIPVINDANSLMSCNEKLFPLQFPEFTPKTYVLSDIGIIKELLKQEKRLVAKPISGKAGEGILVLNEGDKN
ncbi:MAG: hypothetical protein SFU25_03155, partial [Candidatus Caenarcaniphilales bacterium]|nr:hypothetical protein [Candidatus Caenarcaniphilales bacterium]